MSNCAQAFENEGEDGYRLAEDVPMLGPAWKESVPCYCVNSGSGTGGFLPESADAQIAEDP
jgi:hypothetical protein